MSNIPKGGAKRKARNTYTTRSGQTIKINRNLTDRIRASKDAYAMRRAQRLAGMPKSRVKRFFYRMHPKRLYAYWFSREGGIMALKLAGIGLVVGFLFLVGLFAYFRKDLPNLKDVSGNSIGGSMRYYDRTGQTLLWEDYDAIKRIPVKDDAISQYVKDATIAIEDKDFFKHGGFDTRGIIRAGVNNVFGNGGTQGGSTITQQLVKLTNNWGKDRTYTRKVKELILSVEMERSYSKKEILTGYLNTAPYGNVQAGVEAATRDYFEKSAKDLTLPESVFLASIPKSPSDYSPYGAFYDEANKQELIGRMHYILDLMEQQGLITKQQRDDAKKVDVLAYYKQPKKKYAGIRAPYFVLTAKEKLEQKYGSANVSRAGWKVITTLDLNLQSIAEQQVQKGLTQIKRQKGDTAAFVAEDVKTGQVVAVVGNAVFDPERDAGTVNFAREKLPPGSSFKPYDYIALMETTTNVGAGSVLYDTSGPLPGYDCTIKSGPKANCAHDYDNRFPGPVSVRYALGGSRNIPAMKAMLTAGVDKTIQTAEKLMDPRDGSTPQGYKCYQDKDETLTKEAQCYTSASIGDGAFLKLDEHVHGYGSLSRNGLNISQSYILKIEDAAGKTVDQWKQDKGEQVIRADSAYIIGDILADPNASYLSRKPHRYKNWKLSFKTGTTNDSKDGLMMGYSTRYAAGLWVGYHNRQVEMSGFMEDMTQPILQGWMNGAHDNIAPEERIKPAGIQTLPAFIVRNHIGVGSREPSPATDLFPAWFSNKNASTKAATIDLVSNKLATDCTPPRARKDLTNSDANSFSGDKFVGGAGANTNAKDDIHKCDDIKPSIRLDINPLSGNSFRLTADVTKGTHPLSSDQFKGAVTFTIDGQSVGTVNITDSGTVSVDYNATFSGTKTVTATIVDSVLYDSSDNADLTASGGSSSPLTVLTPSSGQDVNASNTTFSWSGGTGPYSVKLNGTPVASCTNINTNSCVLTLPGADNLTFIALVSTSTDSKSVTFKK
jgi:penicillin-binding protein 1A